MGSKDKENQVSLYHGPPHKMKRKPPKVIVSYSTDLVFCISCSFLGTDHRISGLAFSISKSSSVALVK